MDIRDVISDFKSHQLRYGLGGDPEQEELYKWKLVTDQIGHPDVNAIDFAKEINSLTVKNLCYSTQTTAIRHFAEYEPEEYRKTFVGLFDENIDLQERIDKFISDCRELWDGKIKHNFTQKTSAMCDERLISFFLTLKDPSKYTFYKDEVYGSLCQLLGEKKRSAGRKLVHFYELLNQHLVPLVESDDELMSSINAELQKEGCIQSTMLTAQTALWNYVSKKKKGGQQLIEKVSDTDNITNAKNMPQKKYSKYIELLKENRNLVLTGAPGTGKTFMAQAIAEDMGCSKEEKCFVQFHPSYDYTDFVEGLRPVEKADGQMGFERKDGVFKDFCKKATKNETKPFVFVIDEINRGEASKIFGELFYAIDPGYRGKKDIRVKTQYQNLVPDTDMFAEGFYVPENVYILATMNDIDRSVESMDFAMRRRFTWNEVTPEDTQDMLDTMTCATEAKAAMTRLNNVIADTEGLGAAYMVGPSYFLKLAENNANFDKLWTMNIEPLLREYLRGFRKVNDIMKKFKKAYFAETEEATAPDVSDELE